MSLGFFEMLNSYGVDLQTVKPLYETLEDYIAFEGPQKVTTGLSPIDGIGLFATVTIDSGELIAVARHGIRRTPAGRYTNHSDSPNARLVERGQDWCLVACRAVSAGEEILLNYRDVFELHRLSPR